MRKLLTFLIALASIAFAVCSPVSAQIIGSGVYGDVKVSGGGRTCTDDTASTNFLARTSGLSNTLQDLYCNMIKGLESDGIITGNLSGATGCGSVLDGLYIFATNTTTTAKLNLCGTSYGLTYHGTPSESSQFSANNGYTGDGSTVYLDTGFTPSTAGGNLALQSASLGAHILTSRTADNVGISLGTVVASGTDWLIFSPKGVTAGLASYWMNDGNFASVAVSNAQGSWCATRTSNTATALYNLGSVTPVGTNGSGTGGSLADQTLLIMAFHNTSSISNFSSDQHLAVWFGAGVLAANYKKISDRINTFAAGLPTPRNVY